MARNEWEMSPRFGFAKFEGRKHPRFFLTLPIEYYPADSNFRDLGHTVNTSEEGVMVYLSENLDVGQFLKLRIFFSSGPGIHKVEMLSQVIWIDKSEEEKEYRCGMKFVDIPSEDMKKLSSFLNKLSDLSH